MRGEEFFGETTPATRRRWFCADAQQSKSGSLPAARPQEESSKRIWKAWVGLKAAASSWK